MQLAWPPASGAGSGFCAAGYWLLGSRLGLGLDFLYGFYVMVFGFATFLPLIYLRAARALLLARLLLEDR